MTRKKWNRLRRTRPELFSNLPPWEKMHDYERSIMRRVSKARAITVMTTWFLRGEVAYIGDFTIPAPPETPRPVAVPGLAGWEWKLANLGPDPGYPPQSWEKLEESLRKQSAALDKALADPANQPPVEVGQDCVLVEGKFHVEQPPAVPPAVPPQ